MIYISIQNMQQSSSNSWACCVYPSLQFVANDVDRTWMVYCYSPAFVQNIQYKDLFRVWMKSENKKLNCRPSVRFVECWNEKKKSLFGAEKLFNRTHLSLGAQLYTIARHCHSIENRLVCFDACDEYYADTSSVSTTNHSRTPSSITFNQQHHLWDSIYKYLMFSLFTLCPWK